MDEIRIRPGTIQDLPHILRHRHEMFFEMGHTDEGVLNKMLAASEAYFREAMPQNLYRPWMAETAEGRVVGGGGIAIVFWPGSPEFPATRRGWILNVYTDREFRRRGIAKRIMEAILEWSRAEGFVQLSLHASKEGRLLYETLGFQPTNEMRVYLR